MVGSATCTIARAAIRSMVPSKRRRTTAGCMAADGPELVMEIGREEFTVIGDGVVVVTETARLGSVITPDADWDVLPAQCEDIYTEGGQHRVTSMASARVSTLGRLTGWDVFGSRRRPR